MLQLCDYASTTDRVHLMSVVNDYEMCSLAKRSVYV